MRKLITFAIGLVAALALTVPGALGGPGETGVTARTITIGGTFPQTGPAALYGNIPLGMRAYFSYVNSRRGPDGKRGVYGRQIVWKFYDDGYNPANTILLTRRLVEQDKVFATVGQLGTECNLAVRSYLNERKVPQTLISSGASIFGFDYKQYPWAIGWQPDYIAENRLYGLDIKKNHRGKKIAILYQNDDYGKDSLYGLIQSGLGPAYAKQNVVAQEPFEVTAPSLATQMSRIKASGADVFVILAIPTPAVRALATGKALGFKPEQIYMNSVAVVAAAMKAATAAAGADYVNGVITANYVKDPTSPRWNNDPGMKLYRQIMERFGGSVNANDYQIMYGVAKAETFVQALYKAGKNPTRAGLMNALTHMNQKNQFLLPGMVQKTGGKDHFILSQMQMHRFNANDQYWIPIGKLVDARPRGT